MKLWAAQHLEEVVGCSGSIIDCPINNYLREKYPRLNKLFVSRDRITYRTKLAFQEHEDPLDNDIRELIDLIDTQEGDILGKQFLVLLKS